MSTQEALPKPEDHDKREVTQLLSPLLLDMTVANEEESAAPAQQRKDRTIKSTLPGWKPAPW